MRTVYICIIAFILLSANNLTAQTINDADEALFRHDITKATELYNKVLTESADPKVRAEAELRLANIEWRFYLKVDEAGARLRSADSEGVKQADLLIELSRLEFEQGDFAASCEAAERALLLANSEDEELRARVRFAWGAVEAAKQARFDGDPVNDVSRSQSGLLPPLMDAHSVLRNIIESESGLLPPSRLLLSAALLLGDGKSALAAWRSYYRVAPGKKAPGLLGEPQAILEDLLPSWNVDSTADVNEEIVRALADSRFFEEAAIVALDPCRERVEPSKLSDIVAYALILGVSARSPMSIIAKRSSARAILTIT